METVSTVFGNFDYVIALIQDIFHVHLLRLYMVALLGTSGTSIGRILHIPLLYWSIIYVGYIAHRLVFVGIRTIYLIGRFVALPLLFCVLAFMRTIK